MNLQPIDFQYERRAFAGRGILSMERARTGFGHQPYRGMQPLDVLPAGWKQSPQANCVLISVAPSYGSLDPDAKCGDYWGDVSGQNESFWVLENGLANIRLGVIAIEGGEHGPH